MNAERDGGRPADAGPAENRLRTMFDSLRRRAALITYAMAYYPDRDRSLGVMQAMLQSGADALEIGIPFSDPVLDGPVIQQAGCEALQNGATPMGVMELAAELRSKTDKPLLLMTYYNIVFKMGHRRFADLAAGSGVDGIIVPDLPVEEMGGLEDECGALGVALVPFCSVTTSPRRIREASAHASGFLYCVARLGTTGARDTLPDELPDFLHRVRANADCPIAAGIGVSTPEQCAAVGALADGVIVGSALVEEASSPEDGPAGVSGMVASMSNALRRQ